MSFWDRLIHSLAIVTPTDAGSTDEYGQPVPGEPTVEYVPGLVQPKSAREIPAFSQAGAVVADHTIFLAFDAPARGAAYIRFEPTDGSRFDVTGVRAFDFGRSPHLEVDARRIVSDVLPAEAS